jgi:hypothetical protein
MAALFICIPPLSRFARRAGFVALRQTFVQRCQNRGGGGLQSSGGLAGAPRYGIKASKRVVPLAQFSTHWAQRDLHNAADGRCVPLPFRLTSWQ